MIMYEGVDLRKYFNELKKDTLSYLNQQEIHERDFVKNIRNYFNGNLRYVLIVSGLRGTGKTFGILQGVIDFNNTLYVCAQKEEDMTKKDYVQLLKSSKSKYIIIDEFTWIKDYNELSYYLWTMIENGKRVVISGTDSIALDYFNISTLIHRANLINVNMFTYMEYCRIYEKEYSYSSCCNYLMYGGLFKQYAITNFDDELNYIEIAVINNLTNYMSIDKNKARAIVYNIIYLAIMDSSITYVEYPRRRYNTEDTYRNMLDVIGIDPYAEFNWIELERVQDILIKTGFVVKTYNVVDSRLFNNDKEFSYRLHLTNPSLTYHMVSKLFKGSTYVDNCLGRAFEASVVTYMSQCIDSMDYMWYIDLGQKFGKHELEITIVNPNDNLVYLMDSKLQSSASLRLNSSILSKDVEELFPACDIGGRFIICNTTKEKCREINGKKVIFTRLDCGTIENYRDFDTIYNHLKTDNDIE